LDLLEEGRLILWEGPPAEVGAGAPGWAERWRSWLYQPALGKASLHLRPDNKLVIYDTVSWLDHPVLVWESSVVRVAPEGTGELVLGDDGSLAIVAGSERLWAADGK
jgi:hypothetical protein